MATNLLDAGRWLKYSGDCIYGTVSPIYQRTTETLLLWPPEPMSVE